MGKKYFQVKMDKERKRMKSQLEKNLRKVDWDGATESDGGLSVC